MLKDFIRLFSQKEIIIWLLVCLLTNLAIWLLIWWRVGYDNQAIPLHYNSAFGIDWYDFWAYILVYPGVGVLFIIINLLLAPWLSSVSKALVKVLFFATWFSQLIILVSLVVLVINYF